MNDERYLELVTAELYRHLPRAPQGIEPRCIAVLRTIATFYRLGHVSDVPADIPLVVESWKDLASEVEDERRRMAMEDAEYPTEPHATHGIILIPWARGEHGHGLQVAMRPGSTWSTYDCATLTRLVVAGHRWCCRVQVGTDNDPFNEGLYEREEMPWPRYGISLMITPRTRGARDQFERHPTIYRALGMPEPLTRTQRLLAAARPPRKDRYR